MTHAGNMVAVIGLLLTRDCFLLCGNLLPDEVVSKGYLCLQYRVSLHILEKRLSRCMSSSGLMWTCIEGFRNQPSCP